MTDTAKAETNVKVLRAKPLPESRFNLASYITNRWSVTVEAGIPLDAVLEPTYWAHVARKLRPCDLIEVHTEDGDWFAELYVRAARKTEAVVAILRHVKLDAVQSGSEAAEPVTIQFRGPHARYCLMRGKTVLSDKHQTQEDAESALAEHKRVFAA